MCKNCNSQSRRHFGFLSESEVFNTAEEKFVEKREVTPVTFCKTIGLTFCTASGAYCIASFSGVVVCENASRQIARRKRHDAFKRTCASAHSSGKSSG